MIFLLFPTCVISKKRDFRNNQTITKRIEMDLATPMDYRNEVSFDSTTSTVRNDISHLPPSENFKEDASYANSFVEETRRRGRPLKLDKPLKTSYGLPHF